MFLRAAKYCCYALSLTHTHTHTQTLAPLLKMQAASKCIHVRSLAFHGLQLFAVTESKTFAFDVSRAAVGKSGACVDGEDQFSAPTTSASTSASSTYKVMAKPKALKGRVSTSTR